jgi:acyl-coenzyme A synthetase/AMP-(fatty) acid ligase
MSIQGKPVISDLLAKTEGKALVYAKPFFEYTPGFKVPCLEYPEAPALAATSSPLPPLPDVKATDPAMVFHTSGTTSGMPKPVPETHDWLRCQAEFQWVGMWPAKFETQGTFNNLGTFANVGSASGGFISALAEFHSILTIIH